MNKKGFTLVELIIVIAIIAILAGAIFVAIDPARRLHEARNARRVSDIATILDAIKKYQADHAGAHYSEIEELSQNVLYMIGISGAGCGVTCNGSRSTDSVCVDLSQIGSDYLAVIPKDPKDGTDSKTGYVLKKGTNNAITIYVCSPEGEGAGGALTPPDIQVTR